jgi:hypothetical protein
MPDDAAVTSLTARAKPKSATFTWPVELIRMFSGLMSRWINPALWAAARADNASAMKSSAWPTAGKPCDNMTVRRFGPSTSSITR